MRIATLLIGLTIAIFTSAHAGGPFSKAAEGKPELLQQGPEKHWCPVCGMKLGMFWKTSHALTTPDGRILQTCSLHCLAHAMKRWPEERDLKIRAVDASTGELIDARAAHYVIGSRVPGTMSRVSKLAFRLRTAAEAFSRRQGGRVTDFPAALEAARESLTADSRMVATKKRLKLHPAGQRIFAARCKGADFDARRYASIHLLKAALVREGVCPGLPEPELHPVAVYLWSQRTGADDAPAAASLQVGPHERCPVCGMFVAPYPRWVAQLELADGKRLSFDGAKDLFKFLLDPGRWGHPNARPGSIRVTGFYHLQALDARRALYVIGSDVLGPMGHELVPLASRKRAETFMRDHAGERILTFDQIDEAVLRRLDGTP